MRPSWLEKRVRKKFFIEWSKDRPYSIETVDLGLAREGEGDVLDTSNGVFAASGFRTDLAALDAVDGILGRRSTRLELVDPRFYHLDTCFFPVNEDCGSYRRQSALPLGGGWPTRSRCPAPSTRSRSHRRERSENRIEDC